MWHAHLTHAHFLLPPAHSWRTSSRTTAAQAFTHTLQDIPLGPNTHTHTHTHTSEKSTQLQRNYLHAHLTHPPTRTHSAETTQKAEGRTHTSPTHAHLRSSRYSRATGITGDGAHGPVRRLFARLLQEAVPHLGGGAHLLRALEGRPPRGAARASALPPACGRAGRASDTETLVLTGWTRPPARGGWGRVAALSLVVGWADPGVSEGGFRRHVGGARCSLG